MGKREMRAVFLDRDGVLNRAIVRNGKAYSPVSREEFVLTDGVGGSRVIPA